MSAVYVIWSFRDSKSHWAFSLWQYMCMSIPIFCHLRLHFLSATPQKEILYDSCLLVTFNDFTFWLWSWYFWLSMRCEYSHHHCPIQNSWNTCQYNAIHCNSNPNFRVIIGSARAVTMHTYMIICIHWSKPCDNNLPIRAVQWWV